MPAKLKEQETQGTLREIVQKYPDILALYVGNVPSTPHKPSDASEDWGNWTTHLNNYLAKMPANKMTLTHLQLRLELMVFLYNNPGKKLIELERTCAAMDALRRCHNKGPQDYEIFMFPQKKEEQLTRKQFNKILSSLGFSVNSPEYADEIEVLKLLTILSDVGKSKETQKRAMAIDSQVEGLSSDDLVAKILSWSDAKISSIFPVINRLTSNQKAILKEVYPLMKNCLGHLKFLEGCPKLMERLSEELSHIKDYKNRERAIRLVFASQFFDGVGAQGQSFPFGSKTCTYAFFKDYMIIQKHLKDLCNPTNDAELVSNNYLNEKASLFGCLHNENDIQKRDFLLRLFCTLRVTDSIKAQEIKDAFDSLSFDYQDLLCNELNLRTGIGLNAFARASDYVATGALNITDDGKDLSPEGVQRALNVMIVLARLVKKIRTEFDYITLDSTRLCNFGGLAHLATTQPQMFNNPDQFNLELLLRTEPILPTKTVDQFLQLHGRNWSLAAQRKENKPLWNKVNAQVKKLNENGGIERLWQGSSVTANSSQADKERVARCTLFAGHKIKKVLQEKIEMKARIR